MLVRTPSEESHEWIVAKGGMQSSGGTWVIPTAQRTEFRLPGGIVAMVCGETELRDASSTDPSGKVENSRVGAYVPYGRLILFPAPGHTTLEIATTIGVLKIEFADKDSSCALEIRHAWAGWVPPASLPREVPAAYATGLADSLQTQCVIELIGLQGSFQGSLQSLNVSTTENPTRVEVGDRLVLFPSKPAIVGPLDVTPDWLRSSVERPIDQHAARDISKGLAAGDGSPLELLRQLTTHRKGETASMATRLLAQLGDFSALSGPNGLLMRKGVFVHSSAWLNKMACFAHSKERIFSLVESFVQGEPERAETLLRLLIPYSNAQLADGGDRYLVEGLASGLLDERVLAIAQLSDLTGKTFSYHPEKSSADSMQQWRKLLSKSEIRRLESKDGP